MADKWYLLRASSKAPEGPMGTDELRRLIATGSIEAGSRAAAAGTEEWTRIEEIPALAVAPPATQARGPQPTAAAARRSPRWVEAGVILLGLAFASICASTYILTERIARAEREHRAWLQGELDTQREQRAAERTQDQAWARGTHRALGDIKHECVANMTEVTCSFTNLTDETATACGQGVLIAKEAAGVRLYSGALCSGPILPKQTLSKSTYWDGGRANDVCRGASGYLDWQKCDFTVIDFTGGGGK
jgi:hypothetical protein